MKLGTYDSQMDRAIGTPDFEETVIRCVSEFAATDRVVWMRHSLVEGSTIHVASCFDERTSRTYLKDYASLNPFVEHSADLPAGVIVRTSSVMNIRDYRRTAYFGWASRVFGAYELGYLVSRIDGCPLFLTLGRSLGQGDFTRSQEDRLRQIAPAIRRAYFLHSRIRGLDVDERFASLLAAAVSTHACFALAADGALLEANESGDRELACGTLVAWVSGRVRFRDVVAQRALRNAMSGRAASAVIRLGSDVVAEKALLIDVGGMAMPAASQAASWLLFVPASPENRRRRRLELFAAEHGLSKLEGEVLALLVAGLTVESIADALSHAQSTTRAVVKSLLRKTGVHRQTDLILRALDA